MKNALSFIPVIAALLSSTAFAAPSTPFNATIEQQGVILGLAAGASDLESDKRAELASILSGQSYEKRVSVLSSKCTKDKADTQYVTCKIRIGNDDLNDGDSGWGTVWEVSVTMDSKLTYVEHIHWEIIAG